MKQEDYEFEAILVNSGLDWVAQQGFVVVAAIV